MLLRKVLLLSLLSLFFISIPPAFGTDTLTISVKEGKIVVSPDEDSMMWALYKESKLGTALPIWAIQLRRKYFRESP